ncbi:MAG: helix-turn-helix domain-containing protein [Oscillospiraceae bacterium]
MNSFIKVPNALFNFEKIGNKAVREYPLKPIDLYVYLYLLASDYKNESVKRKIKTIAERCNVKDNKTIHSSIQRLESMGLVSKTTRYNMFGFKVSNAYTVTVVPGDFFMLDRRHLNFKLGTSAFCIFVYLNRCSNSTFACPSVSKMANATGISQPTIRQKIAELQQRLYLTKSFNFSEFGDNSNNHYFLNSYENRLYVLSIYRRIKRKGIKLFRKISIIKTKPSIKKMLGSFIFVNYGVGKLFPNTS